MKTLLLFLTLKINTLIYGNFFFKCQNIELTNEKFLKNPVNIYLIII